VQRIAADSRRNKPVDNQHTVGNRGAHNHHGDERNEQVTVNEAAAGWAEYLLLRTGLLYVPGKYVNERNEQWAEKHGGAMPPTWGNDQPWIELSCGDGVTAWTAARQAIKEAQKGKGKK